MIGNRTFRAWRDDSYMEYISTFFHLIILNGVSWFEILDMLVLCVWYKYQPFGFGILSFEIELITL